MPNVPIPLVGPTYTSRSLPLSSQVTRNFYIEVSRDASEIAAFQPFPGLKPFTTAGSGANRGMGRLNGVLYTISGTEIYSITSIGTATLIGTIPGANQCGMESDGNNLVITNGVNKPITWDESALTTGTDADLANSSTVTYINRRVVYDGNNRDIIFPDLDKPLVVQSANVTSADAKPDDVLAVIATQLQLFAFGERSITPFYNNGTGSPPYAVIQNSVNTELGVTAINSICANKTFVYFLGSDLVPYRLSGLHAQAIGNPAIGQAFEGYSNPESARGICFTFHSQNFYMLTFPGNETWLFSEDAGWTNLSWKVDGAPSLINSYQKIYGKHIVADRRNGNIYELDVDTFDDNGDTIIRQRDTAKIAGKDFGAPGKEITMERLEIVVETGVGLITGQGSDPQIMMQYSDDGGRTWSSERWKSLGKLGEYLPRKPIEWTDLGSFYQRMFRFRVSDPVKVVLISANADIEVGV